MSPTPDRHRNRADLERRDDVDNDDIGRIIERADELQAAAQVADDDTATVDEVKAIGRELSIEDRYIEEAIRELNEARRAQQAPRTDPSRTDPPRRRPVGLWLGVAIAAAVGWTVLGDDADPDPAPVPPPVPSVDAASDARATPPAAVVPAPPIPAPPIPVPPNEVLTPVEEPVAVQGQSEPAPVAVDGGNEVPIAGDWILESYALHDGNRYVERALSRRSPDRSPERWRLREDGSFIHVMSDTLSFTGRYTVSAATLPAPIRALTPSATGVLVTTTEVEASIPGVRHEVQYYLGALIGDRLVLYFTGKTPEVTDRMPQGHGFRRSWKGGWTW